MKPILSCLTIISLFFIFACSKKQMSSVLDDISRGIYENGVRAQRLENIGNPPYIEPPTYDQYQRERLEKLSKQDKT